MDACYVPNNPALCDVWASTSPLSRGSEALILSSLSHPNSPLDTYCRFPLPSQQENNQKFEESLACRSLLSPLNPGGDLQELVTSGDSTSHSLLSFTPPLYNSASTFPTKTSSMCATTTMCSSPSPNSPSSAKEELQPALADLEPLPHFVTLSSHLPYKDVNMLCKDKGDHMADVLLSLKHAVVHPHQVGDFSTQLISSPDFPPFHPPPSSPSLNYAPLDPISPVPSSLPSMETAFLNPARGQVDITPPPLATDGEVSSIMQQDLEPPSPPFLHGYNGIVSPSSNLPSFLSSPGLASGFPLSTQDYPDMGDEQSPPDMNSSAQFTINWSLEPINSTYSPAADAPDLAGCSLVSLDDVLQDNPTTLATTTTLTNTTIAFQLPSQTYTQSLPPMVAAPPCGYPAGNYQDPSYPTSPHHVFPAMSVNVSMNMTMGVSNVNMGYSPDPALQHQWPTGCGGTQPASVPPMACMNYPQHTAASNLVSPLPMSYSPFHAMTSSPCNQSYGVGTYSWATDLRGDGPSLQHFERDICLKSPPLRGRPTSPTGPYLSPGPTMGSPTSPTLSALRRRNCVGSVMGSGLIEKSVCGEGLKTNLCRICGKTYARPSTLKTHLRTHSGEKPYRCNECNKSFSQAANLTAHVRTHSGEKPFRCPICDRRFSQSSSVTTHMRTHSGERPYRCRMCKKAFSDSSTLTKHLRIHSGEKPYQCKLCLLRFSQSGNLNRHMRVHSQAS